MNTNFYNKFKEVIKTLSVNKKINIFEKNLITFSENKILVPVGDISSLFAQNKSVLKDEFIKTELIKELINKLIDNNSVIRLNHVGFCYKIDSQKAERERLVRLIKQTNQHLYIEPSNDEGIWYFIGDNHDWESMMIELIPVENTVDKWREYWLPHIQFDFDTKLTEKEISKLVKDIFGSDINLIPIKINDITYIVRLRLGVIDGINIMLDMATSSRNVKFQRQELLKEVNK